MYNEIQQMNKIDIAFNMTNQAVKMFFHKDDPISTHVVICAANEILSTIIKKKGLQTALGPNSSLIKPAKKKDIIKIRRAKYNFFKHADNDDLACINFDPNTNWFFIFENVNFLNTLKQELTKEMLFFNIWTFLYFPNILTLPEEVYEELEKIGLSAKEAFELFDDIVKSDKWDLTIFKSLYPCI